MTWHTFCLNCNRILTLEEMSGVICSECKEEQLKELTKEDEDA